MADLKKLFLYVSGNTSSLTDSKTLKNQIIEKSKVADFDERIFFLADTQEIITHGVVFGASKEVQDEVKALQLTSKALTGQDVLKLKADGTLDGAVAISDDSVIGKYVKAHMSSVAKESSDVNPVTVNPSEATENGITYTIGFDATKIVDDKTVVANDGKLSTGVKLVKKYATEANPTKESTFSDTKVDGSHPVILLTDKDGAILDVVDGNEFVTDGMIKSVDYDEATGGLKFTWNIDGSDGNTEEKSTTIDLSKIFNIEGIHTTTPNYLTVKFENPIEHPNDGDVAPTDKVGYHVDAKVDATDLTKATSVSHTDATKDDVEKYTASTIVAPEGGSALNEFSKITGLADSKKVADKFKATDELIAAVANRAIERDNTLTAGIDEKIAALRKSLNSATGDDTSVEDYAPHMTLKAAGEAIDTLNGNESTNGSVAKSIKDKIEALKTELTLENPLSATSTEASTIDAADRKEVGLAKIVVNQTAGKINDLKLNLAVNTLGSDTKIHDNDTPDVSISYGEDAQKTTLNYYVKDIATIAAEKPAFITNQDAWLYGQAIMNRTVKKIQDDSNKYIHIGYDETKGTPKIEFEPWAEITSSDDLKALV